MKVLVATDGSEFSEFALARCLDIVSGATQLEVNIVSVYEPPPPMATEPFVGAQEYYQYVLEEAKKLAEGYAKKAELMARKRFPNASISIQVVKGKPAQMLVEIADERKADMIVVGSHGRGFWGRALLGSVSDAVVHHAGCSVLVIRKS